jgi:hypothetical protein
MAEPATAAPAATNGAAPPEANLGLVDILEGIANTPEGDEPEAASEPEAAEAAPVAKAKGKDKKPEPEKPAAVEKDKPDHEAAMAAAEDLLEGGTLPPEAAELVKATLDATRNRNRILDKYNDRVKKRDERSKAEIASERATFAKEKTEWEQSIAPQKQAARDVMAELSILDPRSGASAVQRFAALTRLNGGLDGRQLYEEWTLGIAADGKVPEASRSEKALHDRIAQLEGALRQKLEGDATAGEQAQQVQVENLNAGIEQLIRQEAGLAEKYPEIAARAEGDDAEEFMSDLVAWVRKDLKRAVKAGTPLDKATAIGRVEARLARLSGGRPVAAAEAAESGSSKSPGSPVRGAGKGTTVLSTSADRSTGHVREPKTEEERDAENLRDPQFRAALPFLR